MGFNPVIYAIPFFALLIAVEAFIDMRREANEYEKKDAWNNIFIGFASVATGAVLGLLIALIYGFLYELAPYRMPYDTWWPWPLLFLLDDLSYYWFHRISHECRLFWNFHVVHHSSRYFNLSVAVRQSWFSGFLHWLFYAPLMLLGFAPWMLIVTHGFNLIYQFWIHTPFVRDLGPLEYILNTPSHHRVHHGTNEQYLDKNYAGVFIIWDRIFGTFVAEDEKPRYGITNQLMSHNALWVNTHGWVEMFEAVKQRRTIIGKLRCIFGSPNMDFEEKLTAAKIVKKKSAV